LFEALPKNKSVFLISRFEPGASPRTEYREPTWPTHSRACERSRASSHQRQFESNRYRNIVWAFDRLVPLLPFHPQNFHSKFSSSSTRSWRSLAVDSTKRILSRLNFLAVVVEYSAQRSAGNIAKQLGIKPPRLASSFRSRSLIFAIVLFYGESTFREMIHSPLTCSLNRYAFPDLCAAA